MKTFFYLFTVSLLVIYSCKHHDVVITENILSSIKSIDKLSDSSYILSAQSMLLNDNKLFFLDERRSQIIVLDNELNLLTTIGRGGKGPNEFIPSSFTVIGKDTVVVNDSGNNRLQLYHSSGNHIRSISLRDISARLINGFHYNNRVLTATSIGNKAIIMYRFNEAYLPNMVKEFGERYKFNSEIQNGIRNDRYLHKYNGKTIAISDNQPFIELYDIDGNILTRYDYSNIEIIENQLKYIKNKGQTNEKSYMRLVHHTYIFNDNLYILINRNTPQFARNIIIQFSLKPEIIPSRLYYLPDYIYYFCRG